MSARKKRTARYGRPSTPREKREARRRKEMLPLSNVVTGVETKLGDARELVIAGDTLGGLRRIQKALAALAGLQRMLTEHAMGQETAT